MRKGPVAGPPAVSAAAETAALGLPVSPELRESNPPEKVASAGRFALVTAPQTCIGFAPTPRIVCVMTASCPAFLFMHHTRATRPAPPAARAATPNEVSP